MMWLELTGGVLGMWLEPVNNKNGGYFLGHFAGRPNEACQGRVSAELLAEPDEDQGLHEPVEVDSVHGGLHAW